MNVIVLAVSKVGTQSLQQGTLGLPRVFFKAHPSLEQRQYGAPAAVLQQLQSAAFAWQGPGSADTSRTLPPAAAV